MSSARTEVQVLSAEQRAKAKASEAPWSRVSVMWIDGLFRLSGWLGKKSQKIINDGDPQ